MALISTRTKHTFTGKLYKGYYTNRIILNEYYNTSRYFYSTHKQQPLQYCLLSITENPNPKYKPKTTLYNNKSYGSSTDHMLEIDYNINNGWSAPKIKPYSSFNLDPSSNALYHATQAFDGMIACIDQNDNDIIRIFRAKDHLNRLQKTAEILGLPIFDIDELLHCLYELLVIDKQWITKDIYNALYIRPTIIDISPSISDIVGTTQSTESKLFVILNQYGRKSINKPISVFADSKYVRSWPGYIGMVNGKTGCNYSHIIRFDMEAVVRGYSNALWLYPNSMDNEDYICGLSTMNIFFVVQNGDKKQLITPSLNNDLVFDGITRDCILKIGKQWNDLEVIERDITMNEITHIIKNNQMIQVFGCCTSDVITPIEKIGYKDVDYIIKPDKNSESIAQKMYRGILEYQYGVKHHSWSVAVPQF